MKNKICFFNSEMTWGGGEKWHYETANEFLSKGYDVTVLSNIGSEIIKKSRIKNSNISGISYWIYKNNIIYPSTTSHINFFSNNFTFGRIYIFFI